MAVVTRKSANMVPSILFLCLILSSFYKFSAAEHDVCENGPFACQKILSSAMTLSIEGFPDLEQIDHFCPPVKRYFDCVEEYKNRCDFDEHGVFATEQEFVKVQDFVSEICDVHSTLRSKYVENVVCLVSLNDNLTDCFDAARSIYREYSKFKMNNIPERDEPYTANNPLCVSKSYGVMCSALRVLTHCGSDAYELSVELINRSNFLQNFCKKIELHDLQTAFMEFLGFHDEQRQQLIPVFGI